VLQLSILWPTHYGSLSQALRLIETAKLKIAEQQSAVDFEILRGKLPSLLEMTRRAGKVVGLQSLLAFANERQ
jgi:hypothetical protein